MTEFDEPTIDYKFFSERDWRYSRGEIIAVCKFLLSVYDTADDCGTFDGAVGQSREYWTNMPPVFDEFGGI